MGRSYTVPRSAKGESRILYIFSIKSLATTIAFAAIGVIIYLIVKAFMEVSLVTMILIIAPFAGIGYVIGAAKIPDVPLMGPLQKAGGENVSDILLRLITFKGKKKIYMYGIDRVKKEETKPTQTSDTINKLKQLGGKR